MMCGQIAEFQEDSAYAIDIYKKLGDAFKKNEDSRLEEFGKRLDGTVRRLGLMGQTMKLEGELLSGEDFDYSKYLRQSRAGRFLGDMVRAVRGGSAQPQEKLTNYITIKVLRSSVLAATRIAKNWKNSSRIRRFPG